MTRVFAERTYLIFNGFQHGIASEISYKKGSVKYHAAFD
jgi:hypothetical protein